MRLPSPRNAQNGHYIFCHPPSSKPSPPPRVIEWFASINGLQVNVRRLIRRKRLRLLLSTPSGTYSTSQRDSHFGRFSYKLSSELRRMGYKTGFYRWETLCSQRSFTYDGEIWSIPRHLWCLWGGLRGSNWETTRPDAP